MSSLQDRVAIVTGGASGIGRSTALRLAQEGARVCVADLDPQGAEVVAKEIEAAGGEAFARGFDVTDPGGNSEAVAATVERYGGLDVAHLNAGIAPIGSAILDGDVETWRRVVDVNLTGVFLGLRAVAPAMIERGRGSIVATASVAGLRGGTGMPSYYATKHGVVGLVKAAAAELAPHGIRVNAICPGIIDTPILGPAHGVEEITSLLGRGHLLGRVGQPEEVAELVCFLVGDRASFITGAALPVDGGMTSGVGARSAEDDPEGASLLETLVQGLDSSK